MRICANPDCRNGTDGGRADLDELGLRADADSCSPACRAAKSRAERSPEADASRRFWRAMAGIPEQPHVDSPRRAEARAAGQIPAGDRDVAPDA